MEAALNYYHRYVGNYIKKTLDLTMVEDGAYTRLLDWMYANERSIEHSRRHIITRCQTSTERAAVDRVLSQFFARDGDLWTHERAAEEMEDAKARISAAQTNGAKGGRPKGSKNKPKGLNQETQEKPSGFPSGNPTGTHNESSPYTINTNTPLSPLAGGNPEQPELKTEDQPKAKRQRKAKAEASTFTAWLADLKAKGEKAILPADPIFDSASECGIPSDFVRFAWFAFRERYADSSKTYADWRAAFRNAVKGNWLKLWWVNPETDSYELTTAGHQVRIALENRNAEAAA